MAGLATGQGLGRPFLYPPGSSIGPTREKDMMKELPLPSVTSSAWEDGYLPKACYDVARNAIPAMTSADFEVRNLRFSDCSLGSWAVCRHKGSGASWDLITGALGRIPVGMRQDFANLIVLTDAHGCAFVTGGPSIVVSRGCLTVGVLAHEGSHILDCYTLLPLVRENGYPDQCYSSTNMWLGAYKKDSYVVTTYANTNQLENFAEVGTFALSHFTHPGGLGAYASNWTKISNQMGNYQARLENIMLPESGRCTHKVPTTPAVNFNGEAASKRDVESAEMKAFKREDKCNLSK
ncbi:hypothetical protein G7Z17_g1098 [Cylindrodendrum hubeiense]|uniref:Uncharacterized protein n=1 Tax=Cylindrodendrum hubeiense TaxID=595255 RepID=A0A9P5LME7_9HYPO|nr:hypothetical protein G7Z17_g1098 [Cylindrodendrum hubeiense]